MNRIPTISNVKVTRLSKITSTSFDTSDILEMNERFIQQNSF